jgi:outer membrane protein TolC
MIKTIIVPVLLLINISVFAQNAKPSIRDSISPSFGRDTLDIREQLVNLAIQNSSQEIDDANIKIAEYNLRKAKNSWFDNITIAGNVNEFSLTNSTVATYFPRYNFGIQVPLGVFSRHTNDVKIAQQVVNINNIQRDQKVKALRREVLSRYETFLEKKDLLRIEKETVEEVKTTYIKAKVDYSNSTINLDKLTDTYRSYNDELQKVRTADKNYTIAYLELEELVGFHLKDLLTQYGLLD